MGSTKLPEVFESRFLRSVIPKVAADWLVVLTQAWRLISKWLREDATSGTYEVLDYDATLELRDRRGKVAIFKRREKVRFLQDHVIALQEWVWGDGELLADYRCSPGVPVDRYRDGLKQVILISLRETKGRGEVLEFNSERKIKDGFTTESEWFQIELNYKTRQLRMATIFPKKRPCKRAVLVERNRNRTAVLGRSHFSRLPDGRQVVSWEVRNPLINELLTLKWDW